MVNLMAAIATLDGNKVIYVNETTYWKQLALVRDTTGRPLFYSDPATGAITTTFGKLVKIESGIPEGVILAAIPEWYLMNFNRDITVKTADNVTYFRYDVAAHAIVDGAPISGYAFAALVKGV